MKYEMPTPGSERPKTMTGMKHSAAPGERWLVNLHSIDKAPHESREVTVRLVDFDPRTDTWTVKQDGFDESISVLTKHLIRRLP